KRHPKKMTFSSPVMLDARDAGASARFRRAADAQARRGHGVETGLPDGLTAGLAVAVGAGVELRQRVLGLLERLHKLARESVDLTTLRGYLARVREALVEVEDGIGAATELAQLVAEPVPLLRELVAAGCVGGVRHEGRLLPAGALRSPRFTNAHGGGPARRRPGAARATPSCRPALSTGWRARAAPGRP